MRNPAPIIATLCLAFLMVLLIIREKSETQEKVVDTSKPQPKQMTSILAEKPDWTLLDIYQYSISHNEFETLLTEVFTTDDTWRQFIKISIDSAEILTSTDPEAAPYVLYFKTDEAIQPLPQTWRRKADLPTPPEDTPLTGLHIAIDPGHIGGEWAKMEGRWFQIGDEKPVTEGDMTLFVAELLKPKLEALGAVVSLVRSTPEPVTSLRPENFSAITESTLPNTDTNTARKFMEQIFYRTAEIRARAEIVNQELKPDLVLCLHFNADAWGNPEEPTLVPSSHFHVLLNGAYTEDEVRLADQRLAMLEKLLQRTHREEVEVGKTVAETFAEISGLPAYQYHPAGNNYRAITESPYLYARNLLANRLYKCPVIFMEPYVMNSTGDYARIQAGDYLGLREINGVRKPSIFREYAEALATGLAKHYSEN